MLISICYHYQFVCLPLSCSILNVKLLLSCTSKPFIYMEKCIHWKCINNLEKCINYLDCTDAKFGAERKAKKEPEMIIMKNASVL
jgi:hypothetical protein